MSFRSERSSINSLLCIRADDRLADPERVLVLCSLKIPRGSSNRVLSPPIPTPRGSLNYISRICLKLSACVAFHAYPYRSDFCEDSHADQRMRTLSNAKELVSARIYSAN